MFAFLRSGHIWKHAVQKRITESGWNFSVRRSDDDDAGSSLSTDFNVPRRISLLIELVKEFEEYIGNSSCYVGNFCAEARLHFRRSNCLLKKEPSL